VSSQVPSQVQVKLRGESSVNERVQPTAYITTANIPKIIGTRQAIGEGYWEIATSSTANPLVTVSNLGTQNIVFTFITKVEIQLTSLVSAEAATTLESFDSPQCKIAPLEPTSYMEVSSDDSD
jgi:hypothetical protein